MYSVYFIIRNEQSETTLRNSAVRNSIFCGSLFNPDLAIEAAELVVLTLAVDFSMKPVTPYSIPETLSPEP